jgi:hypothetical protein
VRRGAAGIPPGPPTGRDYRILILLRSTHRRCHSPFREQCGLLFHCCGSPFRRTTNEGAWRPSVSPTAFVKQSCASLPFLNPGISCCVPAAPPNRFARQGFPRESRGFSGEPQGGAYRPNCRRPIGFPWESAGFPAEPCLGVTCLGSAKPNRPICRCEAANAPRRPQR